MVNLFREVDEALREDRAKALWKKYGTLAVIAVASLLLGTGGVAWWKDYRVTRDQALSAELVAALEVAADDPQAAIAALAALSEEAGARQGALARLHEAGLLAESGDRRGAIDIYHGLADDDALDAVWRDLGRLLAVLHDLDDGDPAALAEDLRPLMADDSPWRFSARELDGLLAMRRGDTASARAIFEALSQEEGAPSGVRDRATQLFGLLDG